MARAVSSIGTVEGVTLVQGFMRATQNKKPAIFACHSRASGNPELYLLDTRLRGCDSVCYKSKTKSPLSNEDNGPFSRGERI